MHRPFSLSEATDIAEDFSDLVHTGLIIESGADTIVCTIQDVVVAPYPDKERSFFIKVLKAGGSVDSILNDYTGNDFEVLIVAVENSGKENITALPIREYTHAYGVPYRFPGL